MGKMSRIISWVYSNKHNNETYSLPGTPVMATRGRYLKQKGIGGVSGLGIKTLSAPELLEGVTGMGPSTPQLSFNFFSQENLSTPSSSNAGRAVFTGVYSSDSSDSTISNSRSVIQVFVLCKEEELVDNTKPSSSGLKRVKWSLADAIAEAQSPSWKTLKRFPPERVSGKVEKVDIEMDSIAEDPINGPEKKSVDEMIPSSEEKQDTSNTPNQKCCGCIIL